MQIICPNCGSQSPIEAGSLVTQTRIVCARCAVEFAAELSDEQKVGPSAIADERGIELFRMNEVAPAYEAQPATEVAPAEVVPAEEVAPAESAQEVLPAAEISHDEVAAVETAQAAQDSRAPADAYEVLSLPEEAIVANGPVTSTVVAELEQSNVLEDVFAAWNQSRESKAEADAAEAVSVAAAEDYVTSPLSPAYETAVSEEQRHGVELTERPSDEVLEASTDEPVRPVEESAEEASGTTESAESAEYEREPAHATFADAPVPPQLAARQSFDGYGLGVRLMRVSPLWLLVSGLSFISFVVFCNWFFVPANLARADASRAASRRNEATNRPPASAASAADVSAARPDSRNSGTSRAELPAEGEVVKASVKVEEPTPAPIVLPATPAPTAEPVATPRAEQPKPAETVPAEPAGKFTVQVGSYNASAEAEARAASLRSAGQAVRVVEIEIPKRGKWYRVYVGGFGSRGEAESHGKALRERGLAESYIATEAR